VKGRPSGERPGRPAGTAFIGRPGVLANDRIARPCRTQPDGTRILAGTLLTG
jgi:hypothetical protein